MTKIDIFSGFLGAGKTTLIKKLIQEAYQGEKLVLIENEFGEIGIDGGFLQDAGVEITEMNSGCICCSLVGDFGQALEQVLFQFHPDRILIEPSGVGKLSDVIGAVQRLDNHEIVLNAFVTVADATKCKIYMKNFGEFFNNQIEHAAAIVLSRTSGMNEKKLLDTVALLRDHHHHEHDHEHHHHHDEASHEHEHGHEEHHHHDHEHHHHDGSCSCGHDHDADEVFISWGAETPRKYTEEEISGALHALGEEANYGVVLRAKGIVPCQDGTWIHFDYVPGEQNIRRGPAGFTGRLCVIGSELKEHALEHLFCLH